MPFTSVEDLHQVIANDLSAVDIDPTTKNLLDSFNEATEHSNDANSGMV